MSTIPNYDAWKLQESPSPSAEEMDEQAEREQAQALNDLRDIAEDFCDYVNFRTYFGGWSAEIVEGKVLIVNAEAGDDATHEFETIGGLFQIGRGARSLNWFSGCLLNYMAGWLLSRAQVQAEKAANQ